MANIQTVIDALQDAKTDETNCIRITDEARCAMVRILMKYQYGYADCSIANHDATGCLGFGKGHSDDEPIDQCKRCKEYTGNKTGDCDPL